MLRLIVLLGMIFTVTDLNAQKPEFFELNDYINPRQFSFFKIDSSKMNPVLHSSFLGDGFSSVFPTKDLKFNTLSDSINTFIYLNNVWYYKNYQFNVKNFLTLIKDTAVIGFKNIYTSLKTKFQFGFYPFFNNGTSFIYQLRLQASINPIINFGGKVNLEYEFNYGGDIAQLNKGHLRNSLVDYFLIMRPFENTFYYGITEYVPIIYLDNNSIFSGFDFFLSYTRSNKMRNDKSEKLEIGSRIEYLKLTSTTSLYLTLSYLRDYRITKSQLNTSISLVIPFNSKIYYKK